MTYCDKISFPPTIKRREINDENWLRDDYQKNNFD